MRRRTFIKQIAAAGALAACPITSLLSLVSCDSTSQEPTDLPDDLSFDLDEVIDRRNTWSIQMKRVEDSADDKLAMWIADMDFRTDPYVRRAMQQRIEQTVMGYTYAPDQYYQAIAHWFAQQHNYEVDPSWILPAPGVIAGINQGILCFSAPGDKVIVQTPVYNPFFQYVERLGRQVVNNPMIYEQGHYRLNLEELEQICSSQHPKILILCNPHNPVGIVWSRETLAQIADICHRHHVLVFADEIHADLVLEGSPAYTPFCSVSQAAAQTGIIFSSPTKTFNMAGLAGMAHCIIPDEQIRKRFEGFLAAAKQDEPSLISLVGTIAGYTHPTTWLEAVRSYLKANVDHLISYFEQNIPQITPIAPQASFLIWLDCRKLNLPQEELVRLFSDKAGIIVNDGSRFGLGGEGFIRLNIGCPRSKLDECLRRLHNAIHIYA